MNNNDDKSLYLGKDITLEIYDSSVRKLNLSVSKGDIKIMKYNGNTYKIDINTS